MAYLTVAQIDAKIDALAANPSYAGYLSVHNLNHNTAKDNKPVKYLKIGKGSIPVVIVGGLHAREWAPPDSLVSLAKKLLESYDKGTPFIDPAFIVTNPDADPDNDGAYTGNITFDKATCPAADIKRIVDKLAIYIVLCANRDGRKFTQDPGGDKDWRPNRRVHAAVCPTPPTPPIGVDLNRNFPTAWDMKKHYDTASQAVAHRATSDVVCDTPFRRDLFHGMSALSEPEARNIKDLIEEKKPRYYVDVHSYQREIYYPWGSNKSQTTDPYMSFLNDKWDNVPANPVATRGRPIGGAYKEYIPTTSSLDLLKQHITFGGHMRNAVLKAAGSNAHAKNRSGYAVKESFSLYPTAGDSSDYAFSTQLEKEAVASNPAKGHKALIKNDRFPLFSFTMESGHASDGEFWPSTAANKRQFRKVQREIHFAMLGLLASAAAWTPPSTGSGSIFDCFIATTVYGSENHDHVDFLRSFRDVDMQASPFAAKVMSVLNSIYCSFSLQAARYISTRPRLKTIARTVAVSPLVAFIRVCRKLASNVVSRKARADLLACLLLTGGALGALLVAAGITSLLYFLLN